ncbi:MAG: hypothetical protein ACLFR1_05100 [Spirochaetia bacterium]
MANGQDASSQVKNASTEKIYCANCKHCKLVRHPVGNGNQYQLRVRCTAGKWRKKLGEEKIYKYFTVARRSLKECDTYVPMGDTKDFIKELKKTLPIKDEIYNLEK